MLTTRKILVIITFFFVILLVIVTHFCLMHGATIFQHLIGCRIEYYGKMKSIQVGMTEEQLIEVLGKPSKLLTCPEVTQYHGDANGKKIENVNRCLVYYHGIDFWGNYFINGSGEVYFVNVGGT